MPPRSSDQGALTVLRGDTSWHARSVHAAPTAGDTEAEGLTAFSVLGALTSRPPLTGSLPPSLIWGKQARGSVLPLKAVKSIPAQGLGVALGTAVSPLTPEIHSTQALITSASAQCCLFLGWRGSPDNLFNVAAAAPSPCPTPPFFVHFAPQHLHFCICLDIFFSFVSSRRPGSSVFLFVCFGPDRSSSASVP